MTAAAAPPREQLVDSKPRARSACGGVRSSLGCRGISIDGRSYRYALQRPPGDPVKRAVLVDLGGPGRTIFSSDDMLAFAKEWPRHEVLLFLEEPWVTQPLDDGCEVALSRFYLSLRENDSREAGALLARDCGLGVADRWGWRPETHAHVVRAILAAEHLELTGIVGTSFGAARTEALWSEPTLPWLILNSPAPHASPGADYLAMRREGVLDAFARACGGCGGRWGAESLIAAATATLAASPITLPTRTPPVDAVDLPAALVGLTHLPAPERAEFAESLRLSAVRASASIGWLSDGTLLRYGEHAMSPAMLAYMSEICPRYNPWPENETPGDPVTELLLALHSPCRAVDGVASAAPAAPTSICIAHGSQDDVTPFSVAASWKKLLPHAEVLELPDVLHGAAELARACRVAIEE